MVTYRTSKNYELNGRNVSIDFEYWIDKDYFSILKIFFFGNGESVYIRESRYRGMPHRAYIDRQDNVIE